MSIGPWEIILVLFVILLLFGSKKLPDLARALGRSMNEFKKGREEGDRPPESASRDRRSPQDEDKEQ